MENEDLYKTKEEVSAKNFIPRQDALHLEHQKNANSGIHGLRKKKKNLGLYFNHIRGKI